MHAIKVLNLKLARVLVRFAGARGGNVAIIFALAMLPVVGSVGFAVDYSRANSVKAAMQAALDSTAMMLSKDAPTASPEVLQSEAYNYFTALFRRPEATNIKVSVSYNISGGSNVVMTSSADVATALLGVIGYDQITVAASTTAKWGSSRLRVALVLDNTGSMSSHSKIDALKTATKNLLSQLKNAVSTDGDVYVSIIPFSKDVNVGTDYVNENWLRWDLWEAVNGTCSSTSYTDQDSCTSHSKTWTPASHSTWNGCVTDRGTSSAPGTSAGYDQDVTAPTPAILATLLPAEQYSSCPKPIMGLNYNWTTMNSLVDSMTPNGNTNQPIGLALGWQSLVGGGPFTVPLMDADHKYQQIIILLSDGMNTQDRWYSSQSSIDNRMLDSTGHGTCANINAAGVTLYTIQVNTGSDPTSTLLKKCAGSPGKFPDNDKFFLLTSADQIVTTFKNIGTDLTRLRVAQ